jgi:methyl-accepting chemotaxis protein
MKDVHYLEDNFKSFANLINRFHSIDVASRIEVAKQDVLRQMSDTVEEMTELTAGIDNDVNTSLDATKEFIKTTNSTIGEFRSIYAEEEVFVKEFTKSIKSAYDSLFDAKNELTNSISNFSLFTNQFFDLFQSTAEELENLKILIDDIDSIIEKLSEIKKQTADKMEPLLASRGLSEWHIENEKLKSIINRFTIFTHKKTAGDIGGFEVEEGTESGEITFF